MKFLLAIMSALLLYSCLIEKEELDTECQISCTTIRGNVKTGPFGENVEDVEVLLKNFNTGIAGGVIITKGLSISDDNGNYKIEFSYIDSLYDRHGWKLEINTPPNIYNPEIDDEDEIYRVIIDIEPEIDTMINFNLPKLATIRLKPNSNFDLVKEDENIFFYMTGYFGPIHLGQQTKVIRILNSNNPLELIQFTAIAESEIIVQKEIRNGVLSEYHRDTLTLEPLSLTVLEYSY